MRSLSLSILLLASAAMLTLILIVFGYVASILTSAVMFA